MLLLLLPSPVVFFIFVRCERISWINYSSGLLFVCSSPRSAGRCARMKVSFVMRFVRMCGSTISRLVYAMKRRAFETVAYRSFVAFFHLLLLRSSYVHFSIVRSDGRSSLSIPFTLLLESSFVTRRFGVGFYPSSRAAMPWNWNMATHQQPCLCLPVLFFFIILFPQFGLNRMRICEGRRLCRHNTRRVYE